LRANIQTAAEYNKQRITKPIRFRLQDRVWLRSHVLPKDKHAHKCIPRCTGPYLVIQIFPDYNVYRIQHCQTLKICPSLINADRLRLCVTGRDRFYTNTQNVATDVDSE